MRVFRMVFEVRFGFSSRPHSHSYYFSWVAAKLIWN